MVVKSRQKMPQYAPFTEVTFRQWLAIYPRGKKHPATKCSGDIRIAQTKDGKYWAEWRGDVVFWASRWYEIPKTVGTRARKIDEFVKGMGT